MGGSRYNAYSRLFPSVPARSSLPYLHTSPNNSRARRQDELSAAAS